MLSLYSQGKVQVLQFNSSIKKIGLAVNVTNYQSEGKLAEDAHRVVLNVTIPDVLKYASVSSLVGPLEGRRCPFLFKYPLFFNATLLTRCTLYWFGLVMFSHISGHVSSLKIKTNSVYFFCV